MPPSSHKMEQHFWLLCWAAWKTWQYKLLFSELAKLLKCWWHVSLISSSQHMWPGTDIHRRKLISWFCFNIANPHWCLLRIINEMWVLIKHWSLISITFLWCFHVSHLNIKVCCLFFKDCMQKCKLLYICPRSHMTHMSNC